MPKLCVGKLDTNNLSRELMMPQQISLFIFRLRAFPMDAHLFLTFDCTSQLENVSGHLGEIIVGQTNTLQKTMSSYFVNKCVAQKEKNKQTILASLHVP